MICGTSLGSTHDQAFLFIRALNSLSISRSNSFNSNASLKFLGTNMSCAVLCGVGKRGFAKTTASRKNARCAAASSRLSPVFSSASMEAYLDNYSKIVDRPGRFSLIDGLKSASRIDLTVFIDGM